MSYQLTADEDQELFPLCEETELGHVLRNRRMKIVRQRALELFYPKLPPFYKKNFVTFMRILKDVRGGSLLGGDMYVGGSSSHNPQLHKNEWHHELARRCPPVELAPEADFQSSLFPTLSPLTEGGNMPVTDLFNAIYVDILFPYDVPVQEKKARTGTRSDEKEHQAKKNDGDDDDKMSPEEKQQREEEAAAWKTDIPLRKMEDAPTSEASKTWVSAVSSSRRFARVFLPSTVEGTPKDSCSLFVKDWHPEFLASLEAASSANLQKQQQQQQGGAPTFAEAPYQPQVTAWIMDVIFRSYDEQNFIQIQPRFADSVKNLSFDCKPIAIRHCVINKVALLSTGHLLLLDSIRHKVYGRISLKALLNAGEIKSASANSKSTTPPTLAKQNETRASSASPTTSPEELQQQQQQQQATNQSQPQTVIPPSAMTNQSFARPMPFTAESSSSLVFSAANLLQSQQSGLVPNSSMGVFSNSFSQNIASASGSFAPNAPPPSVDSSSPSPTSVPNNSSNNSGATFEQQLQHFYETTGISFVGNSPNEPHRFMSLGLVVFKSMVKTYEHACDADCPLSWNDVLYPELYSQAS